MNSRDECEVCGDPYHEQLSVTSKLAEEKPPCLAGDLWHRRSGMYLCQECSDKFFRLVDNFFKGDV
tara:strand:+ start:1663 stop:1860 length:198 start_codon:yes stop_codon:yes gene_type:complete